MEFFVFRLNKIKIFNNREWGEGEVKLLSFVTGIDGSLRVLDGIPAAAKDAAKNDLVAAATKEVLSSKQLFAVENVRDGHKMTFGDTGFALYTARKFRPH